MDNQVCNNGEIYDKEGNELNNTKALQKIKVLPNQIVEERSRKITTSTKSSLANGGENERTQASVAMVFFLHFLYKVDVVLLLLLWSAKCCLSVMDARKFVQNS